MKRYFLICVVISAMMMGNFAMAQSPSGMIDEVVWVVGDEAILLSDVESQYRVMQGQGERINGDPYCVIPEQIAIQKLFLNQAILDSVYVTESEVFSNVEQRINAWINSIGSKEKVEEYFGATIPQLREELTSTVRDQLTVEAMQRKLIGGIKISPADVRRFYANFPADSIPYIPVQVEVQLIRVDPLIPQQEIDDIKARLREYTERITSGEADFSTLAILYSEDPVSARRGGDLGFFSRADMVPEFTNAAFSLNDPKKVSKIVETEFGYHIIQLIEKRGDRIDCRHILLRPRVSDEELNNTFSRMDTLRQDILDEKISFEDAAQFISQDKETRNNKGVMVNMSETGVATTKFQMDQLPQEVAKVVDKMEVGEISEPFLMIDQKRGKECVAIVKLKSRIPGHKANISNDFQILKGIVEDYKRNELIDNWIRQKQKETYIRIKEGWDKCEFTYDGWIKK